MLCTARGRPKSFLGQQSFVSTTAKNDDGVIPEKVDDYFNPRKGNEDEMTVVGDRGISIIALGALDALQRIDSRLPVACGVLD